MYRAENSAAVLIPPTVVEVYEAAFGRYESEFLTSTLGVTALAQTLSVHLGSVDPRYANEKVKAEDIRQIRKIYDEGIAVDNLVDLHALKA